MDKIRERLNEVQVRKSRSVSAFAAAIGCDQATVSRQLKGEMKISLKTILSLLSAYEDINADWLMRGRGEMIIKSEDVKEEEVIEEQNQQEEEKVEDPSDLEFMRKMMESLIEQNKMLIDRLSMGKR